jgi:phosphoserine phosphatase
LQLQVFGPSQSDLFEQLSRQLPAEVPILKLQHAATDDGVCLELTFQAEQSAQDVNKRLGSWAQHLGLQLRTREVPSPPQLTSSPQATRAAEPSPRYLLTLFGATLTGKHLSQVSAIAAKVQLRLVGARQLSPAVSPTGINSPARAIEFTLLGGAQDPELLRASVLSAAQALECDVAFQVDNVLRQYRRLVVFDMDSTLIQAEVIDELARAHGVVDQVSKITEAAMNGELDFNQSLQRRLSLLQGLSTDVLQGIAERVLLMDGAERLVSTLKKLGYKTAILSGGFTYFGHHFQRKLGIDYVFANELEIKDGALTGKVVGGIVNAERKAQHLRDIAQKEGIPLEQTIAVGDGANDLPMLALAGLGVAFRAKPKVRAAAKHQVTHSGLDGILYMLGLSDADIDALAALPPAPVSDHAHPRG